MTALPAGEPPSIVRPGRIEPVDLLIELRAGARPPIQVTDSVLRFHYDVHGVVTVGSVAALPELAPLRCRPIERPDLVIEEGWFGSGHLHPRPLVTQYAHVPVVSYEEHRGLRGFDFLLDMSDGVRVVAAPMLTHSPLVLCSDVLRALLRFMVVPRGYVLLWRHGGRQGRNRSSAVTIMDAHGDARPEPSTLTVRPDRLIAPAHDEYGFLPFRYVVPGLVMDGLGYDDLRIRERAIRAQAVRAVKARRLGRPRATTDPATPVTPL